VALRGSPFFGSGEARQVAAGQPDACLPPSKLSCFYYAIPFMGYLSAGGFYPRGRSQDISSALARYIEGHGGKVLLSTKVERILLDGSRATGVATADGTTLTSRAVVSNADPFATFTDMIADGSAVADYEAACQGYSVSLSSFQVFLGLNRDLVGELGITGSEVFIDTGYDPEASYAHALAGDVEQGGLGVTRVLRGDPFRLVGRRPWASPEPPRRRRTRRQGSVRDGEATESDGAAGSGMVAARRVVAYRPCRHHRRVPPVRLPAAGGDPASTHESLT
jgi:phytoene dehydrogenase-like protein